MSASDKGKGLQMQCESYSPGLHSMPNLNEKSNGGTHPLFYGDRSTMNGHYSNGNMPRAPTHGYPVYDKNFIKQKMLEHEAIFKNQVHELHRVYKVQKDMMDELKNKELHIYDRHAEASFSSNLLKSQMPAEEFQKGQIYSFPSLNSISVRPTVTISEDGRSFLNSILGKSTNGIIETFQNGDNSKDCEILEVRPTKVRRKMFDLELPADEYIDTEEIELLGDRKVSKIGLTDLNEPFQVEEGNNFSSLDTLEKASCQSESREQDLSAMKSSFLNLCNGTSERKENGKDWMSSFLKSGIPKSNLASHSQSVQPETFLMLSQQSQVMLNKDEPWRNGPSSAFKLPERSHDLSHYNHQVPFISPNLTKPYQSVPSSDLAKSGLHSLSSWEKPISSNSPQLNLSTTLSFSRSPVQKKGQINGNSVSNSGVGNEVPNRNGFYHGSSSSGFKAHFTSNGLNFLNRINESNHIDLNSENHLKSDTMLSHNSSQMAAPQSACDAGSDSMKKSAGFPIYEKPVESKNENLGKKEKIRLFDMNIPCDSTLSDSAEDVDLKVMEKQEEKEVASSRHFIDLNSCASEDEDVDASMVPESQGNIISDEAPQKILKAEHMQNDEDDKIAAEAIVVMSSSDFCNQEKTVTPLIDDDPLHWFADAISSCPDNEESSREETDYFESMTLKLTEVNIEEYMSELAISEKFKGEEEPGNDVVKKARKGRRGMPKRDFQKDILPGIVSLSRLEVAEDIQTIGGLMRGRGQEWHVGFTRRASARNGYGRGKQRIADPVCSPVIQQIDNSQIGLDKNSSLTGWGKTTRRPRRRRCPNGNLPPLPLT